MCRSVRRCGLTERGVVPGDPPRTRLGRRGAKLWGGWLHVPAPEGPGDAARVRAGLVSWFRRRAAERLPERVEAWHAKAGVPMPRIKVVSQAKRWGSCDHAGTIRLNWRIIQAPMRLVDYVVVHELVHLRHRGHGRDYWQAVGRVMPDYERRRRDSEGAGGVPGLVAGRAKKAWRSRVSSGLLERPASQTPA